MANLPISRSKLRRKKLRFSTGQESSRIGSQIVCCGLFASALRASVRALKMIKGAYALAIIDSKNPDTLYAVRISNPLVVGVGSHENLLASDPSALVGKTRDVIYLKDGEIAEITKDSVNVANLEQQKAPAEIVRLLALCYKVFIFCLSPCFNARATNSVFRLFSFLSRAK